MLRRQLSLEKFSEGCRDFIEKGFDIAGISQVEVVFEKKPAIDGDGVLTLKGNYPAEPNKVTFRLRYLYEKSAWKSWGIKVEAMPEAAKMPTDKGLKALVRESLLEFNKANRNRASRNFIPRSQRCGRTKRPRKSCRKDLPELYRPEG